VQSFNNKTLRVLGRVHNAKQAKEAIILAREYFENISIDLIHSVPGCRVSLPRKYLKMVRHISAYCLTSEKYAQVKEERSIREQQKLEKILQKQGLKKYEVSNFARDGYQCRHNLVYWQCGEWLGFGKSAESHFNQPWSNNDKIMLGLRLAEGIDRSLVAGKQDAITRFQTLGLVTVADGRVKCTGQGFLVLNEIIRQLTD